MADQDKPWEVRKMRKNGEMGYVSVPKTWLEALGRPASEVLNVKILFAFENGKPVVRLLE